MIKVLYNNYMIIVSLNIYQNNKLISKAYNVIKHKPNKCISHFNNLRKNGYKGKFDIQKAQKIILAYKKKIASVS